jgi:NAD(P)-dependent dehydrogenase (short-subunit alcohol dehydrogenase family)
VNADVRHEDDVRNLVDKTVARFGHASNLPSLQ